MHFYRNVFSNVPKGNVADVARVLKAIHAQEDRRSAQDKIGEVITKLKAIRLTKAAGETVYQYLRTDVEAAT